MNQEVFQIVLTKGKNFLKQRGIEIVSERSLMEAVPLIIECVETMKKEGVTGSQKKNLSLKVLLFIVNESKIDEEKKVVLRQLIDGGTVETTIDIIIDASKGRLQLNKKTKRKLLLCLGQCLTAAAAAHVDVDVVEDAKELFEDKVTETINTAKETVEEVKEVVENTVTDVVETAKETVEVTVTEAVETATEAVETATEAAETATNTVENVTDAVEEPLPEITVTETKML